MVIYQGKEGTLRDTILQIKYNKAQLFIDVQQGVGNKSDAIFILVIPKIRLIVQK